MKIGYCLSLLLILAGCGDSQDRFENGPGYTTMRTPYGLRTISADEISARISFNGVEQTYFGSDYPDGNWQIPVDLEADQNYELAIDWFSQDILLMEERGSVYTDAGDPTIQPDLDFFNAGYQRFDLDCDGLSNLQELDAGTSPNIPNGDSETVCQGELNPNVTLGDAERAYLIRPYEFFGQESQNRVITKFEQQIQVRQSNNGFHSSFGASLYSGDVPTVNRATIQLFHHMEFGKEVQLIFSIVENAEPSSVAGAKCDQYETQTSCIIPYQWDEGTWYTLTIEKISDSQWIGRILNQETGVESEIGTMTAEPELNWLRPELRLEYAGEIPPDLCQQRLLPLRAHYKGALFNSTITAETLRSVAGPCVDSSGDWNYSVKTRPTEPLMSLGIGKLE